MNRIARLSLLSIIFTGCASSSGSYKVNQPLSQPLTYDKIGLKVTMAAGISDKFSLMTEDAFIDVLDDNTFKSVAKGNASQVLNVKIVSLNEGDDTKWALNMGGNADVTMEVEIISNGKKIGQLNVTGTSDTRVRSNVNQYGKSAALNAIHAAAKQLEAYFASTRGP